MTLGTIRSPEDLFSFPLLLDVSNLAKKLGRDWGRGVELHSCPTLVLSKPTKLKTKQKRKESKTG